MTTPPRKTPFQKVEASVDKMTKITPGALVVLRAPKSPLMVASEFITQDLMGPCAPSWRVHWTIQGALRVAVLPECTLMVAPAE